MTTTWLIISIAAVIFIAWFIALVVVGRDKPLGKMKKDEFDEVNNYNQKTYVDLRRNEIEILSQN